jgi:hypothetical protein
VPQFCLHRPGHCLFESARADLRRTIAVDALSASDGRMSEVDTATLAELATQRQAESIFATVLDVDTFINCTCVPSSACEAAVAASQASSAQALPSQ